MAKYFIHNMILDDGGDHVVARALGVLLKYSHQNLREAPPTIIMLP